MGQQNPLPYDTSRMTSFSSVGIIPVIKASPQKKKPCKPLSINYQSTISLISRSKKMFGQREMSPEMGEKSPELLTAAGQGLLSTGNCQGFHGNHGIHGVGYKLPGKWGLP